MALLVTEIFYSIQGESSWAGLPCVFVRLSGCNLRCHYCDTPYAYEPGELMAVDEIVRQAGRFDCKRLTVTGGEPLVQEETPLLVTRLIDHGYDVSMETNGSIDISPVDQRCVKIVDVKCPSSGMHHQNLMTNLRKLGLRDQIKFVIANQEDFSFSQSIAHRLSRDIDTERILLSPVHGVLPADRLASWMLEVGTLGRLHLQLHKIIWPDKDRGV